MKYTLEHIVQLGFWVLWQLSSKPLKMEQILDHVFPWFLTKYGTSLFIFRDNWGDFSPA